MSGSEPVGMTTEDVRQLRALSGATFYGDLILPSGKKISAEEATALSSALAADPPVVPGPVANESLEQRRALAEARLLAEIDAADETGDGRRAPWLGVLLIYVIVVLMIFGCTALVWTNWPTGAPHL